MRFQNTPFSDFIYFWSWTNNYLRPFGGHCLPTPSSLLHIYSWLKKVTAGIKHLIPSDRFMIWPRSLGQEWSTSMVLSNYVFYFQKMSPSFLLWQILKIHKIHLSKKPSGGPKNFPACRWAVFKQLLISNQSLTSFQWITMKEVSQISIFVIYLSNV